MRGVSDVSDSEIKLDEFEINRQKLPESNMLWHAVFAGYLDFGCSWRRW